LPLDRSCTLGALRTNIASELEAGRSRDQAVAIAHSTLRTACNETGVTMPSEKDIAGIVREFKRKRGERGSDYLEEALTEARRQLPPSYFAAIHQAARSRAGGRASARARMTSIEKSLVLGADYLTSTELSDAVACAEEIYAAELRRAVPGAASVVLSRLYAEVSKRDFIAKSSPGASDVHVPSLVRSDWRKKKRPDLYEAKKADRMDDPGVMIALRLQPATAEAIAVANGEEASRLHVTLAYLGRFSFVGAEGIAQAAAALRMAAYEQPILRGCLSGVGRFAGSESSDHKDVIYASLNVQGLAEFRECLVRWLGNYGVLVKNNHAFTPHITLAYVEPGAPTPRMTDALRLRDVYFDSVVLAVNDSASAVVPLGGMEALAEAMAAAAAAQARELGYSPAAPVEVLQAYDSAVIVKSIDGAELVTSAHDAVEPGDMCALACDANGETYVIPTAEVVAAPAFVVKSALEESYDKARYQTEVPFVGPANARVVFVADSPSALELARGEPLVGPVGATFNADYLAPLGLARDQVALGFVQPTLRRDDDEGSYKSTAYVNEALTRWPQATVIALGRTAAETLGDRALLWLPHPSVARKNESRYEEQVSRKLRRVRKALDDGFVFAHDGSRSGLPPDGADQDILAGRIGETLAAGPGRAMARIAKAADEEQVVIGVVLDPYEIDTQGEWVPPAVIKKAAHGFLESRVIGREHVKKAGVGTRLVESWIERYPSVADEKQAHALLPHNAYETKIGTDKVHSGAWMAAVKLSDSDWAAYKRGEITGFSIGGFSYKSTVTKATMPKVTFVAGAPTKW
jgi:uracil-DNA glycosylase family 4